MSCSFVFDLHLRERGIARLCCPPSSRACGLASLDLGLKDACSPAWCFPCTCVPLHFVKLAVDVHACVFGWVRWSVRRFFFAAPRPGEEVEEEDGGGVRLCVPLLSFSDYTYGRSVSASKLYCCSLTVYLRDLIYRESVRPRGGWVADAGKGCESETVGLVRGLGRTSSTRVWSTPLCLNKKKGRNTEAVEHTRLVVDA